MNRPVRTTIVLAIVCGALALPVSGFLGRYGGSYPVAFKCVLWMDLAVYVVFLARWSRTPTASILFPVILLLGAAIWPGAWLGFHALALGVLCWVRSGICYRGAPLRALIAETLTVAGGITLVGILGTGSAAAWPLGICLFILVQSLYFYIIPAGATPAPAGDSPDPFEQARHEAEKVLGQLP